MGALLGGNPYYGDCGVLGEKADAVVCCMRSCSDLTDGEINVRDIGIVVKFAEGVCPWLLSTRYFPLNF